MEGTPAIGLGLHPLGASSCPLPYNLPISSKQDEPRAFQGAPALALLYLSCSPHSPGTGLAGRVRADTCQAPNLLQTACPHG